MPRRVAAIVERWRDGGPSGEIAHAGLLVKMMDNMADDWDEPWHACRPPAWCSGTDHVSASLVNRRLPHLYTEEHPGPPDVGFVLSPRVTFYCAMVADGGTISAPHGGCDERCTCGAPDCYYCVFHPEQLADFVRAHEREAPASYSEVVILREVWEGALPASIEAVICTRLSDCTAARDVHRRFLLAYQLSGAQVPLLRYSPEDGFTQVR